MRTVDNIEIHMMPLEDTIRSRLLSALLNGYNFSDMERNLFSLPTKFGGLGIFKPQERCSNWVSQFIKNDIITANKARVDIAARGVWVMI